jgi:creatinine amidohydrolase/Fe(II)-dependent formamide hydrolase-like protein
MRGEGPRKKTNALSCARVRWGPIERRTLGVSHAARLSTWSEIEARLKTSTTVVVPIGSNEQHGPTGLLGTDWLCPEIIAHEASKRAGDRILVAPTFNIGMAQHHLAFPGTIFLRPSTFIAAIGDWVRSWARTASRGSIS